MSLGPLYHDFSWLGLPTEQLDDMHRLNQSAKAPVICAYILLALAKLKAAGVTDLSFAEFFCADGYYTMFAAAFGATRAVGFDDDRDGHLHSAELVRAKLGLQSVTFRRTDILDVPVTEQFAIVANVGGLYHVTDPMAVLRHSYEIANHYLIVQSVVTLASESPDYLERPAPGWAWGNRFSRQWLAERIRQQAWDVVDQTFNTLPGNARPDDQGSVYYLIRKHAVENVHRS
jgi:hypothetical protein